MTQRPEVLGKMSGRRWVVAGVVAILVVVAVALLVGRGEDSQDAQDGRGAGDGGTPTSLPSADGLGSPTVTPSPGQTEPGVAETPTVSPGLVRAKLGDEARLDRGVAVEVVDFESVQGEARGAGERAGPAVRLTVELANDSSRAVDLRATVVTAYFGPQRVPANELSGPGTDPFPASVAPGESATGIFVFRIPPKDRADVRVDVSYRGESPTAVFTGSVR